MKKNKSLTKIIAFSFLFFFTSTAFAQFSQLGQILSTGKEDAEKILDAYISPYANGMGAGLSAGWYNTAKSHKLGGFDVTFTLNAAIIPTSDKTYDPANLGLGDPDNGLTVDIGDGTSQTAAGKREVGQQLTYYQDFNDTDIPIAQLNLPKGTGFGYTPVPMVQVGIGTIKETDVIVRYSPELDWGTDGKVGLWGVGIKHSIKQWIPALKRLPVLEMSVMGGYTKLTSTTGLNFQPSFYEGYADYIEDIPSYYDNQEMLLDIGNVTANLLVSANLPIICIYGGVGISSSTTNLKFKGNYPFPEVTSGQVTVTEKSAIKEKDMPDISIKSKDGSVTKPRLNAGFRLKFAVVTLHFDYTYADYSIATAGLGVTLR